MPPAIVVRPAADGDRGLITGLVEELLRFGSPVWRRPQDLTDGYRQLLSDALERQDCESRVFVAEDDDRQAVGFLWLRVVGGIEPKRRGHVAELAVSAQARRQGAGAALIDAAESWCRKQGLEAIDLDVWSTNEPALAFYRRQGYQVESHRLVKVIEPM